ncbi:MAG TPA: RNA-binding S4 domain-containing protein [Acidimicrobiales bacterium]|nr:RNA-binding S4 domain-containing protein [Acidimicrobiales bacterium]
MAEETRVDRWLWAVRLYKTRSSATDACRGGHVRINDDLARPATRVRPGDVVHASVHGRPRVLEVVRIVESRVGAPVAATCLIDHSPPAPPREHSSPVLAREPGSGRPTKRDRRQLDRLRGSAGTRRGRR